MKIEINGKQRILIKRIQDLYHALEDAKRLTKIVGESNDGFIEIIENTITRNCRVFFDELKRKVWIELEE